MKKMIIWLLLIALVLPYPGLAQDDTISCKQGDTFEAVFSLTPDSECPDGIMGQLEYDDEIFKPVSPDITMRRNKDGSMNAIVFMHGQTISVPFQVNRYAPDGLYTIGIKVLEAAYADGRKTDQVKIAPVQVRIGLAPTQQLEPTSSTTPKPATAAPETDFEYKIDHGRATITRYKGTSSDVIIPDKMGGRSVTFIEEDAFRGCKSLVDVTIPYSVISIGDRAFYECSALTGVTIPDSVQYIGHQAFYECSALISVTIPGSVTTIGLNAFSGCSSLISIDVDSGNSKYTSVNGILFSKSKNNLITYPGGLAGVYTIPNNVISIKDCAFWCCGLTDVMIPNSVTSIGIAAFYNCTNLTCVTIPESVTSIGTTAFNKCSENLVITVSKDSYAEEFCKENNLKYSLLSSSQETNDIGLSAEIPMILNQAEYLLYQDIFYNGYTDVYKGTETEKQGIFAIIQDAFNNTTSYYVWGYLDSTKCCDWQWEFVPQDLSALPAPGSTIIVKGIYEASDSALDGFWIRDAEVTTLSRYIGEEKELNMLTMSDTLERVQLLNILYQPDKFEGKAFIAYGRIASNELLQDPYYDGSWQIAFTAKEDQSIPAIGTTVILNGKVQKGILTECTVKALE